MNRKKTYIISLIAILFFGCSKGYEQSYETFDEFDKQNERNKGWFPKIILQDATKLYNISYLDSLCAFGKFSYNDTKAYDSIFSLDTKINYKTFSEKVERKITLSPKWFLNLNKFDTSNILLIKKGNFFILNDKNNKTIQFILFN
jgi:hypothetical protein